MIRRFAPAAIVALTLVVPRLDAQKLEPRPVPSRGVVSFTFQSPSMGVRFAVNVGLPAGYKQGDGKTYPALITTDGDWAFPTMYESARSLDGEIAPLFLVSIGTGLGDGDTVWTARRVFEFSPPDWERKDPFGVLVSGLCQGYRTPSDRCTGGAPKFLNAIVSELIPLVADRYPIDRNQLGLFGVSAGGFFASWAMFQPNAPFKKYLISSPAMAYGDLEIFRQESRFAAGRKDFPVSIYFGAGSLEIQHPMFEGTGHIVSGMNHLAGVLASRGYPGLKMTTEIHPGMNHTDVLGTVAVRGLRTLYGKP